MPGKHDGYDVPSSATELDAEELETSGAGGILNSMGGGLQNEVVRKFLAKNKDLDAQIQKLQDITIKGNPSIQQLQKQYNKVLNLFGKKRAENKKQIELAKKKGQKDKEIAYMEEQKNLDYAEKKIKEWAKDHMRDQFPHDWNLDDIDDSKTEFRKQFDAEMSKVQKEFGVTELEYREKALEMGVFDKADFTEKEFNQKIVAELRQARSDAYALRIEPDFDKQLEETARLLQAKDARAKESAEKLAQMLENKAGEKGSAIKILQEMRYVEKNDANAKALDMLSKIITKGK
ncbi:MAG: hypothetical protein FWE47_04500 [Oscillospiraceae bacterium]|nr:hypothetical protein [Oscillospiraceae bacterium]